MLYTADQKESTGSTLSLVLPVSFRVQGATQLESRREKSRPKVPPKWSIRKKVANFIIVLSSLCSGSSQYGILWGLVLIPFSFNCIYPCNSCDTAPSVHLPPQPSLPELATCSLRHRRSLVSRVSELGWQGTGRKSRQPMFDIREPERQHNQCFQLAALLKMGRIKSRAAGKICGRIFVQKGRKGPNFLKVCFPPRILCNSR